MKLLMISGDRSILQGKKGAFWYTLEEFSKHWERIDVICPKTPLSDQRSAISFFGNVFFHPSPHALWRQSWWILKKGKELFAEHHHDVMTVHEYPPFYNGTGARWLHASTNVPFALEIHHIVGWPKPASTAEAIGSWLSRKILPGRAKKAAAVRVVNRTVQEELAKWRIDPGKIRLVPSFYLDREMLVPDVIVHKDFDVVACGRFVPSKGFRAVIEAVSRISGVSLLLIGDGPERESLERYVKFKQIGDRVTFSGWLQSHSDVIHKIQTAQIFVMNSKSEGGPRVALEAMAVQMPVISTRVGVMPEVMEEGKGGIFTTGEPEDLSEKIQLVLENEALRSHLAVSAEKILDRFEKKKLIEEYAQFLKSIAKQLS